jgi:hypothetical protein
MSYWDAVKTVLGISAIQGVFRNRRCRRMDRLFAEIDLNNAMAKAAREYQGQRLANETVQLASELHRDAKGRWILHPSASSSCCGGKQCQCKKSN